MKLIPTLIAVVGVAQAVQMESEAQTSAAQPPLDYAHDPNYFNYNAHHDADYSVPYDKPLPGPDFNKNVYDFNNYRNIFSQDEYDSRIGTEAHLLVAIESLKESTSLMHKDITGISDLIHDQRHRIDLNIDAAFADMEAITESTVRINNAAHGLAGKCGNAERDIREERDTQVLFCQQFAYAPDMVAQCRGVLSCRQTKKEPVRQQFQGRNYANYNNDFDEIYARYQSDEEKDQLRGLGGSQDFPAPAHDSFNSQNFPVPDVSGGLGDYPVPDFSSSQKIPSGSISQEVAAAAVNDHEALLRVDGREFTAPMHSIDPDKVELQCDDNGCVLVPDDGNPYNDVTTCVDGSCELDHAFINPTTGVAIHEQEQIEAEILRAAVNSHEAAIHLNGERHVVPMSAIDADKVELRCDGDECVLVPDDGIPNNDFNFPHSHGDFQIPPPSAPVQNQPALSSHGYALNEVGHFSNTRYNEEAELAAAAVNNNEAVIQVNGQSFYSPFEMIDPDEVELAQNSDGYALIPDDGNPHNDIFVPGM